MASVPPSTPFPSSYHAQHSTRPVQLSDPVERPHYPLPCSSSPSAAAFAPVSRGASFLQATPGSGAPAGVLAATQPTMQGTVDNPLIPKKRRRTTPAELNILEHEFRSNMRPDPLERARIAEHLGMTARAVQVWYQNRRQKEKKESSSSSSVASTGSDPRDLDGVLLSFSSSPLPSPALPLHPSAMASTPGEAGSKAILLSSQDLFSASPAPSSSSSAGSVGSNKENSYFPSMSSSASSSAMPASSCGRVTAPALLAASAGLPTAPATTSQPYTYTYEPAPATQRAGPDGGALEAVVSNSAVAGPPGVYLRRPSNASIIAAKKHVRKRPQGSHAPLARVPSLPHAFVFPPSPVKPSTAASAGARPAFVRKASLNDVASRQQKKAVAAAGLFAHAQGETVAGAARRRRSSTPAGVTAPAAAPVATAAPTTTTGFAPDDLAPFAQTQLSSLVALTPVSKAKAKDDLLRHMESDPPSASSPAPLTRRRMIAHEASMADGGDALEDENDDDEDLPSGSLAVPRRPAPTRSLSASQTDSPTLGTSSTFARAPTMGRTASLGAFPSASSHSRASTSSATLSLSGTLNGDADSPFASSSTRAGASRSCAVEALGRKRARILETQAALPPLPPKGPATAPAATTVRATRAPSTRPSTSAYATQALAMGRRPDLELDLAAGARQQQRKRRRVSAESTTSAASASAGDDDSFAELSFSSTSTANTVDSLVTVADDQPAPAASTSGYFALTAAAKHASESLAAGVKTHEDEQRECAELLLGLGGFC